MTNRRKFLAAGIGAGLAARTGLAAPPASPSPAAPRPQVIDGMMHLEVFESFTKGSYWEGMVEEVLEHYDRAGIDRGVILVTWTPSRQSNDRTLKACQKYPGRFIPFGHIRTDDPDWQSELKRVAEPPWKGLKLHQAELLRAGGKDLRENVLIVVRKAAEAGIRVIKIHLVEYPIVEEMTRELAEVTWILPHLGCHGKWNEMRKFCELARNRPNVYLDTSAVDPYWRFGEAIQWAGVDKVTFATDGFLYCPLVEKAKIEALTLPTPFRTPRLTPPELSQILGGNTARILDLH